MNSFFRAFLPIGRALTIAALALALPSPVTAAEPAPGYQSTLDGRIVIAKDGSVADFTINEDIPAPVQQLLDQTLNAWRFEPILIAGRPVNAETALKLMLQAEPLPDGDYQMQVVDARFGDRESDSIKTPPAYPKKALRAGVGAQVMLAVRVDPEGNVVDTHPHQTSLSKSFNSESITQMYRREFETHSAKAVRKWKFAPGDRLDGQEVDGTLLVPITFTLGVIGKDQIWNAWHRGPISPAPWLSTAPDERASELLATANDNAPQSLDQRFRLLTPVAQPALD